MGVSDTQSTAKTAGTHGENVYLKIESLCQEPTVDAASELLCSNSNNFHGTPFFSRCFGQVGGVLIIIIIYIYIFFTVLSVYTESLYIYKVTI